MPERLTTAFLLVTTREKDLEFISEAFGCKPDRTADIEDAEPFSNDPPGVPGHLWVLNSPLPDSTTSVGHLEWFCRLLDERRDSLVRIKDRATFQLGCDVTSDRPHDGGELSPAVMRVLAGFDVHVTLSVTRPDALKFT
ncbi:DUF4279 domain-containing protein [Luteolibacter sp. LG18]|uniref:DUF4279 domain-containing protein n=1 Tax=Luteolibacter sp. LG18 TaxID=2819286 RepID=UPI002B322288|nr:hypothetical protein llg_21850 [Luteolibacter sp. LG18]